MANSYRSAIPLNGEPSAAIISKPVDRNTYRWSISLVHTRIYCFFVLHSKGVIHRADPLPVRPVTRSANSDLFFVQPGRTPELMSWKQARLPNLNKVHRVLFKFVTNSIMFSFQECISSSRFSHACHAISCLCVFDQWCAHE